MPNAGEEGASHLVAEASRLGEAGAHSIFSVLERTADRDGDLVSWETLDWHNQPQRVPAIFTGMGGIVFFLADYARITGSERALALAEGAMRWCASPDREPERDPEWEWASNGIMRGRSGLGLGWLALHRASGDPAHLAAAQALAAQVIEAPVGPVTDWQDGVAGEVFFLLRAAQASGDAAVLRGAQARAAWLEQVALRRQEASGGESGEAVYWPWQTDHEEYARWLGLSFVPGSAGIGHVLLSLYEATGEARWAGLARGAAWGLLTQARPERPDGAGLNWPDTRDGFEHGEPHRSQWCFGAPGVGLFFTQAHRVLQRSVQLQGPDTPDTGAYLRAALGAGEATFALGDARQNPCLCHGLAGNADFLLELYEETGDSIWLERALSFTRQIFSYRRERAEGDVWQSDDPGCASPDYLYGVAGTGHYLLRLWRPDRVRRPLF